MKMRQLNFQLFIKAKYNNKIIDLLMYIQSPILYLFMFKFPHAGK